MPLTVFGTYDKQRWMMADHYFQVGPWHTRAWQLNLASSTSFFLCFLPILLVYYPIFMAGVSEAKAGDLPPIAVWGGNLLVAAWGCLLLRSVVRR